MAKKRLSRQESRLQTREDLLEAAANVFSRRGFYEASIDEIAEEAGFSKGAVYSNFTSKQELFITLLDRHLEAELQSIAAQFTPNEKTSGTSQRQSFPTHLEEKRTWNLLSVEFLLYAMRHPAIQQQLAERYRMARNELTEILREAHQTKLPPEYIAWGLLALGGGLALQAYLEPGAMPSDLYSTLVEQLLSS